MIWKDVFGQDLTRFMNIINLELRRAFNNINANNLKLSKLEIDTNITTPDVKPDKIIIYHSGGVLKYKNPDGSTGTINVTPDP